MIGLYALLPDLRGYSAGDSAQFFSNAADSPLIHLLLRADTNGLSAADRAKAELKKADAVPPAPQRSVPRIPKAAKVAKKPGDGPGSEEEQTRARHNNWTIGIAGGLPEDSFALYAADLAKALDDGDNLRVLPIMSYGASYTLQTFNYAGSADYVFDASAVILA